MGPIARPGQGRGREPPQGRSGDGRPHPHGVAGLRLGDHHPRRRLRPGQAPRQPSRRHQRHHERHRHRRLEPLHRQIPPGNLHRRGLSRESGVQSRTAARIGVTSPSRSPPHRLHRPFGLPERPGHRPGGPPGAHDRRRADGDAGQRRQRDGEVDEIRGDAIPREIPRLGGLQRARRAPNHRRLRHSRHALALRALRPQPALRYALRNHPRGPRHRRPARHHRGLQPGGQQRPRQRHRLDVLALVQGCHDDLPVGRHLCVPKRQGRVGSDADAGDGEGHVMDSVCASVRAGVRMGLDRPTVCRLIFGY